MASIREQLEHLGYGVTRNAKHPLTGRNVAYKTWPISGSGVCNYHPDRASLEKYARDVATSRERERE